jgi:transposase-like protein
MGAVRTQHRSRHSSDRGTALASAADILGFSPRTLRRWRERYEQFGYEGLLDGRRRSPSAKRAPVAEVTQVVQLLSGHVPRLQRPPLSGRRHGEAVLRSDAAATRSDEPCRRRLGRRNTVGARQVALQKRRIDLRDVIRDAAADATSDVASAAGHFRQRHEWTDNLAGLALPTCWRTVAAPQVLHNRHLFERRL